MFQICASSSLGSLTLGLNFPLGDSVLQAEPIQVPAPGRYRPIVILGGITAQLDGCAPGWLANYPSSGSEAELNMAPPHASCVTLGNIFYFLISAFSSIKLRVPAMYG